MQVLGLANSVFLLGQRARLKDLTGYFRGPRVQLSSRDAVFVLLGLAGMILAVWLLSLVMNWQETGRKRPSPMRLFVEICRAHRLGWRDGWLLWRLAKSQRLSDPARIFLEPERFEPIHLVGTLRFRVARLAALRDKLFARAPEGPPSDGRDPTWRIPSEARPGTPLAPITPTPRLT
ncbi:MAG: hypothetical protein U1E05_11770 [Patescibacteria group bacterium]|nr:hypothetical protein [Patescibacteria group bacterium]